MNCTATLMAGLLKHRVAYVMVIDREEYYYDPAETTCFDLLRAAYPQAFRLADADGQARIYEVVADSTSVGDAAADRPPEKLNSHR
jgi:hypothetical protein